MVALAALATGPPTSATRPCTPDDSLALEAVELSLDRDPLEVMERQVVTTEEALASWEARIQWEVKQKVVEIREALVEEYHQKLGLQEAHFKQRQVEL